MTGFKHSPPEKITEHREGLSTSVLMRLARRAGVQVSTGWTDCR